MEKLKEYNNPETYKTVAIVGGCAIVGCAIGTMILPAIGFTGNGVAPLSYAATWQSGIGNVAAGSLFSIGQSMGATGAGTVLFGGTGALIGAAIAPYAKTIGTQVYNTAKPYRTTIANKAIDAGKYVVNSKNSVIAAATPYAHNYANQAYSFCYKTIKSKL
ncbi:uncharacterized protein LOC116352517 [Contarinia nasturtii]|uniref:uncharacterized protein LOC116352517 n=1 Tax=Contarinia nasturtii TaxID=265458 RepID=UPI0012D3D04E|nr:uncharacterized protein LOC116352517 [Contarinia nasturtii]